MVRVGVGVGVPVMVMVGLAGGVQDGRGVVDEVIIVPVSMLTSGDGGGGVVVGIPSGVWLSMDIKRTRAITNIRIDNPRIPNITGSVARREGEGAVMFGKPAGQVITWFRAARISGMVSSGNGSKGRRTAHRGSLY